MARPLWVAIGLVLMLEGSASAAYQLTWSVVTAGGGESSAGQYTLVGTVAGLVTLLGPPGQATNPSPTNGALGVGTQADLSWTAGTEATSHDVYLGTSQAAVANADHSSPEFKANQTAATYDPGLLLPQTSYYWRIDEIGTSGITPSVVWSFSTGGGSDVDVVATNVGGGRLKIGYVVHQGLAPRSIALRISLAGATIQGPADVVSREAAFNAFMDYAKSFPQGYSLGSGHPLADRNGPGVPNFGSGIAEFSINMARLDPGGSQTAGPASCDNLVTLQLHGSGQATVTVALDTLRSNSFLKNNQTTNLPFNTAIPLP